MNLLSIIGLALALETGYVPESSLTIYNSGLEPITLEKFFYAEFHMTLNIKELIYIKGTYLNIFEKSQAIYFTPLLDNFTCEISLKLKPITIGFRHSCHHPINVYPTILPTGTKLFNQLEGGTDLFFIRFEAEI